MVAMQGSSQSSIATMLTMRLRRGLSVVLVSSVVAVLALSCPQAVAQTKQGRPSASLWLGAGIGGKLDDAFSFSVGVRVYRTGVVFYQAVGLDNLPTPAVTGSEQVLGRERDSLRGFDLLYFNALSHSLVAYTGGGYYFERGCNRLVLTVLGERTCEGNYKKRHFSYSVGAHYSPGRIVVGYGYHGLRGHEITLGLRF